MNAHPTADAREGAGGADLRALLDTLTPERRALLALRLGRKAVPAAGRGAGDQPDPARLFGRPGELVEIQPGLPGRCTPFFCVHPAGGNVFCYTTLARHLGAERPFYGLPSSAEAGGAGGPSLEVLAARYVETLRRARPAGPYLLGGWSMGGLVAFEMARQLDARGEAVALVALLDSKIPTREERRVADDETALLMSFARDLGLSGDAALRAERLRGLAADLFASRPDAQLARLVELARRAGVLPPGAELAQVLGLLEVFKTNVRAMCAYVPRAYGGPVKLFKAREQLTRDNSDETLGWGEAAAGGLEILAVPGDHYTIMREPDVRALAERLADCLRRAERG